MIDPSVVLAWMLRLQPEAPWSASYPTTASAIATLANHDPVFEGDDGPERTAAVLTSIAWFEGRFKADAEGGYVGGRPTSFCTMQVDGSNFGHLGVTRRQVLSDIGACIWAGLRMVHVSFYVCRHKPLEGRLDHYATGGGACTRPAHDEGGHRMRLARWLASTRVDVAPGPICQAAQPFGPTNAKKPQDAFWAPWGSGCGGSSTGRAKRVPGLTSQDWRGVPN